MMGMKRFVLNEKDYSVYGNNESVMDSRKIEIYNISKNETVSDEEILQEFNKQDISNIGFLSLSTIKSTYLLDIMVACLLVVVQAN